MRPGTPAGIKLATGIKLACNACAAMPSRSLSRNAEPAAAQGLTTAVSGL
jgi:hypothetical protein